MSFQTLLAKRYIFSQKRHSILTICSIVVALTFMSMLFTGFSTIYDSKRSIEFSKTPYHCLLNSVTKEQGDIIAQADDISSCALKKNENGTYSAEILFEKFIKDENIVLKNAMEKAGLYTDDMEVFKNSEHSVAMIIDTEYAFRNCEFSMLMIYDLVGTTAWYTVACAFSLFFVFIIILIVAMRLVIDTAFEISSKERERQFGVLQSIGATPSQVVKIINTEGALLSLIGIPIGLICGNLVAFLAYKIVLNTELLEAFLTPEQIENLVHFSTNPVLMIVCAVTGYFWVWLSAYSTGMRIIKMSPMQAITNRSNTVKKVKKHSIYGLLFGWQGKLASRNARRSKKRFWITVVSLTISITLFSNSAYVIDSAYKNYEEYLDGMGIDYDLYIGSTEKLISDNGYKNTLKELENTGYFSELSFNLGVSAHYKFNVSSDESDKVDFSISYFNEAGYLKLFNGNPPVSYDELAKSGEFIMIELEERSYKKEEWKKIDKVQKLDEIPLTLKFYEDISEAEYDALPLENRENYYAVTSEASDSHKENTVTYHGFKNVPLTVNVNYRYPIAESNTLYWNSSRSTVGLVGTCEHMEKARRLFKNRNGFAINCILNSKDDYHAAVEYLNNHKSLIISDDAFKYNYELRSSLSLAKIIMIFISVMTALISIVNMVNIISTGILNRRSELAAMQCVGMTKGQMYGMITVECLQYVFVSGIVASLASVGVVYATESLLKVMMLDGDFKNMISYSAPQAMVWICTAVAFAVALITALISIQGLQKQSLVEQIRSVD